MFTANNIIVSSEIPTKKFIWDNLTKTMIAVKEESIKTPPKPVSDPRFNAKPGFYVEHHGELKKIYKRSTYLIDMADLPKN